MFDLTLKTARVVSIDDESKQGKIRITIEPEFEDVEDRLLPWAIPLISNTSDSTMEFHPPKENSQVWVLVDKYYKRFYYISNRYFYNLFDFSKTSGLLDKCEKIDKEYKNLDFKYYLDGTLTFHNNSDGSSGIITSQGTLIYIDEDGSVIRKIEKDDKTEIKGNKNESVDGKYESFSKKEMMLTTKDKFTAESDNKMSLSSKSGIDLVSKTNSLLKIGNSLSTVGSLMTELCEDLSSLLVTGATTDGTALTATSPTLSGQMSVLISKIKMTFS